MAAVENFQRGGEACRHRRRRIADNRDQHVARVRGVIAGERLQRGGALFGVHCGAHRSPEFDPPRGTHSRSDRLFVIKTDSDRNINFRRVLES
jgi:hypothetical protein